MILESLRKDSLFVTVTIRKTRPACYSNLNVSVTLSFKIQIKLAQMSIPHARGDLVSFHDFWGFFA